ncbi:MAG: hypothetical protein H0U28_03565, partial [Nocardioidaceae bacterium]|nr:hypothetical protein [Nocardioidaceae bacterium]
MFKATMTDEDGATLDSRDVPATPRSGLARAALPRFAAVLDAEVQALNSVSLLDLGAAITECAATLDWMLCKT